MAELAYGEAPPKPDREDISFITAYPVHLPSQKNVIHPTAQLAIRRQNPGPAVAIACRPNPTNSTPDARFTQSP